jgi:D-alanyl-lipoteichoic acid acyltransferase DltB (MBOAT superfamily)
VDFWKRWHISLSRFITTYLYTPLARLRERITFGWALFATFTSMVIAGIWHGAALSFVIFGALHGAGLVTNQLWKKTKRKLPKPLAIALTLAFVDLAFVFFRAPSMAAALRVLRAMFGASHSLYASAAWGNIRTLEKVPLWIVAAAGLAAILPKATSNTLFQSFRPSNRALAFTVALAVLGLLFLNTAPVKDFVYLDF